ncbi:FAD-binding oxidoreductase [Paenochrobactrum glaciei]|uniref:FAD-dependent oxidoreductase n=1 Tax=Paenochrobactrum glaciei TaxID=486407 RepID=A0ABN1GPE2_9HYPH
MQSANGCKVLIIGGGIVGLTSGLNLARRGCQVSVLDPCPSPGGASYGNAGMISAETSVPIALPGMLSQVPKWLLNPNGPLVVNPADFPSVFPWLLRWIDASRLKNVLRISEAMRSLHKPSLDLWKTLLGSEFDELITLCGQIHVWSLAEQTPLAKLEAELRERQGIASRLLTRGELDDLCPGISHDVKRAIFVPGNAQTVSPQRLTETIERKFLAAGGERLHEKVLKIVPLNGHGFMIYTNLRQLSADKVVIAAGVDSLKLLKPLGIKVPLTSERGYHLTLRNSGVNLISSISHKSRSVGITSLSDGLRIAGTVEIAASHRPPKEERALMLLNDIQAVFPNVKSDDFSCWMGCRPSFPDSLPLVDHCQEIPGLFFNFGHGHFGLTGSVGTALLLAQIMMDEPTFIPVEPYSRKRFNLMSG